MRTFFAMHCITRRNKDDAIYNRDLERLGYDEAPLPDSEMPSNVDIAQGQIDEPLIEKGKYQAMFIGEQMRNSPNKIKRIYVAKQQRCLQTAQIVASELGYPVQIVVDDRLNARSYGEIASQKMDSDKLKHFYKYPDVLTDINALRMIAFYLVAPEKIGAEPKGDFKARVKSFLHDGSYDFNDAMIIAGSDVWKFFKDENYFFAYKNEEKSELKRGQIAVIDFEREKEVKTIKSKEQEKTK